LRLGLLGGTFDPIHMGHLVIAEAARAAYSLDQVVFIPAGDPPHKGTAVTAAEDRYAMTLLATASHPGFQVSRREIERQGPSFSLTTIHEYQQEIGPESELYFIVGADAVLEIRTWHRWEEVLQACHFIAVSRPGFDSAALDTELPGALRARVSHLLAPGFDLSSTQVRDRVAHGEPIRYLVPESVETYIYKQGLYQAPSDSKRIDV
jgi:nicotinate-nucleotide adenylyltransferase